MSYRPSLKQKLNQTFYLALLSRTKILYDTILGNLVVPKLEKMFVIIILSFYFIWILLFNSICILVWIDLFQTFLRLLSQWEWLGQSCILFSLEITILCKYNFLTSLKWWFLIKCLMNSVWVYYFRFQQIHLKF